MYQKLRNEHTCTCQISKSTKSQNCFMPLNHVNFNILMAITLNTELIQQKITSMNLPPSSDIINFQKYLKSTNLEFKASRMKNEGVCLY